MDAVDLAINCSLALKDVAPRERASRARDLGYEAVEFWWPFEGQDPRVGEVTQFVDDVRRAEVETTLLNFPGGGAAVGDRGLLCVPGREDDFVRSAEIAVGIGQMLGVTRFNPMVGNTASEFVPGSAAFETAVRNLIRISPLVASADAMIVLEPLSGFADAALKTFAQAKDLVLSVRAEGAGNVAILFDLYHAATNGDHVLNDLTPDVGIVGHVQIADAPGRGWPGTGALPLGAWVQELRDAGYRGRVGLECVGEARSALELRL